jgi:uncharacterized protein (DUF885 family)
MSVTALVGEYLSFCFERDPIHATRLGVHDRDHELGDVSPDAMRGDAARRRDFLRRFEAIDPAGLTPDEAMERQAAMIDARTAARRLEDLRYWARAPYWYVERLGGALGDIFTRDYLPLEPRGRAVIARLLAMPAYLRQAAANLADDTPPMWIDIGRIGAKGLDKFLAEAVPGFAAGLPEALRADTARAVGPAREALAEFAAAIDALRGRARGAFACGADHFDFLLRDYHKVGMDHRSLYEFGLYRMAEDRMRLETYAKQRDPSRSWIEQMSEIKERHPRPEAFLSSYEAEMVRARAHCIERDLITLPEGEVCRMAPVPSYLRASLPIGVMYTTPPFAPGLESGWWITPLDPEAPPERQKQHMRDNCYAFARSIALHEIYPGHHTQKVHHKLATRNAPMRRYLSCPIFVEGWGLYTEDLFEETGFVLEPDVFLFKLRNALWRSVRVVIDTGLHTRNMTFEEGVRLLQDEVCLDAHMAEGEVRRYCTHLYPTYPSSYLVGKTLIIALREEWRRRQGAAYSLRAFHDRLLSYGSPPVALVAERMLAGA